MCLAECRQRVQHCRKAVPDHCHLGSFATGDDRQCVQCSHFRERRIGSVQFRHPFRQAAARSHSESHSQVQFPAGPVNAGSFSFMVSVADKSHAAEGLTTVRDYGSSRPCYQADRSSGHFPSQFYVSARRQPPVRGPSLQRQHTAVSWSASAGTVTATGLFTAPNSTALPATVQLVATSKADPSQRAIASVTITAPRRPRISPLPAQPFLRRPKEPLTPRLFACSGGTAPYHWKIASGALPSGLALDEKTGGINGITSQTGPFPFTVEAGDASGKSVSRNFTMNVLAANAGNLDGPAELPRAYVNSSLKDTPAPGATHPVSTKAALQTALTRQSAATPFHCKPVPPSMAW